MLIHDLDTPAVVIDLNILERNLRDMVAACRDAGIPLRAHTKSHKIPEIAHMQIASGVNGICCQKVGEAEVMVAAGLTDVVDPVQHRGRVESGTADAAGTTGRHHRDGGFRDDGAGHLRGRAEVWRYDPRPGRDGHGDAPMRCVYPAGCAGVGARFCMNLPGIDFQGVMTYPSKVESKPFIDETIALIRGDGIPVHQFSAGGTGDGKGVGGNRRDRASRRVVCVGACDARVKSRDDLSGERCPLRIITTVVSVPTSDRIILDGGLKTFCSYPPIPYGYCVEHPEIFINRLSIEHGIVDTSQSSHKFQVGDRLSWIPLHQEMALNLHDEAVGYRGEQVEVVWPVAGRGKVK